MKRGAKESTRNHIEIKGEREEDTIHPIQRALQILIWNHQSLIVILTRICPHHLMLVLQATTVVREGKNLREEINTKEGNEGISGVIESEGVVIRDLSGNQKGCCTKFIILSYETLLLNHTYFFYMIFFLPYEFSFVLLCIN